MVRLTRVRWRAPAQRMKGMERARRVGLEIAQMSRSSCVRLWRVVCCWVSGQVKKSMAARMLAQSPLWAV